MSARPKNRILPREAGAAPLDFVIAVMAFLAALALGFVLIANRTAEGWQAGLAGRFTVQIVAADGVDMAGETDAALGVLRATKGVVQANALSDAYSLSLVEPWLGRDVDIAALPFPKLIDAVVEPGASIDTTALAARLKAAAPHATLDDHSRWIERLRSTAGAIVYSALGVLALIAVATAATVAFATQAGLAARREIVILLHLMGARDSFISRAFEWHYLIAAFLASLCGAGAAAAIFAAATGLEEVGIAGVSFLPPLGLRLDELGWLGLVPVVSAIIAWGTARTAVFSALKEFY